MTLTERQQRIVEANMGLVGRVINTLKAARVGASLLNFAPA